MYPVEFSLQLGASTTHTKKKYHTLSPVFRPIGSVLDVKPVLSSTPSLGVVTSVFVQDVQVTVDPEHQKRKEGKILPKKKRVSLLL